jgi:hypothetical protein
MIARSYSPNHPRAPGSRSQPGTNARSLAADGFAPLLKEPELAQRVSIDGTVVETQVVGVGEPVVLVHGSHISCGARAANFGEAEQQFRHCGIRRWDFHWRSSSSHSMSCANSAARVVEQCVVRVGFVYRDNDAFAALKQCLVAPRRTP